jgi:ADP-ribose pyrophosphatase YjhB (NUDIX family)
MTTVDRAARTRQVYFHDPSAPAAALVVPSVFVAVRWLHGSLLLVRRCDSGAWELPGGRVEVGQGAVEAAVRKTADEAGVRVEITGFAGLFSDPSHVACSTGGEARQQLALLFHARALGGVPRGDQRKTSDAAWVPVAELPRLVMEPRARIQVARGIAVGEPPHLG